MDRQKFIFNLKIMCCRYTLEWLDSLITVSLNPAKTNLGGILPEQIVYIKSKIEEEKTRHQTFVRNKVFSLLEDSKIEVLIRQYYSTIVILLNQAHYNKDHVLIKKNDLKEVQTLIIQSLEEMLSFIEIRYSKYLSLDERAPITYLLITKKELSKQVIVLKGELQKRIEDKQLFKIVFSTIDTFLANFSNDVPVSLRETLYIKELVKKLQDLCNSGNSNCNCAGLHEILIYLNFNSKDYLDHYIFTVKEKISSFNLFSEKLEVLLVMIKDFNQINCKSGVAMNNKEKHIKKILENWFNQEVQYLERKINSPNPQLQKNIIQQNKSEETSKIKCSLSVDQLSLFLRAADDGKVIIARSLNDLFKQIVPYLSTSHTANISYDSMRSKSYSAETRDKEIVIHALEQMIKNIKEY